MRRDSISSDRLRLFVALQVLSALPNMAFGDSPLSSTPEFISNGVKISGRLVFREQFQNLGNWVNLAPRTIWKMEQGILKGYWAPGGSEIWLDREFEGNILIKAEARVLPPDSAVQTGNRLEGGKNFNIRFHVRGPNDVDILDVYQNLLEAGTGQNGIGDDQYWGYLLTWTWRHSRLRKSPGYMNVSENDSYLPELTRRHKIQLLFIDGRILYTVDGKLLHDYTDPSPFNHGRIAILTWNTNVEVSEFEVYEITESGSERSIRTAP